MTIDVMKKLDHRKVAGINRILLLVLIVLNCGAEAAETLGVIYPQVREPFSRVYDDIVQGIRKEFSGELYVYSVDGNPNFSPTPESTPDVFVALGNKSLSAAQHLEKPLYAAVPGIPSGRELQGAIILKPSAEAYLTTLLDIYPAVDTVHVVYNEEKHRKLIDDATSFLNREGKQIDAIAASDIRESARAIRKIVNSARSGEAIWLISDSGLIDGALLDVVLDSAWDKRLAVFSSNPSFVKRGALFAIYPDNVGIGRSLARMVMSESSGNGGKTRIEYLKDVKVAYNERTGNHIGVKLTPEVRERIDLILPEF